MTATFEQASPPRGVCLPWCRYGTGHRAETHLEDQNCCSEGTIVELTRVPQVFYSDSDCHPERIEAMLRSGPRMPLSIALYSEGLDLDVNLTLGEARALASALSGAVDVAESTDC